MDAKVLAAGMRTIHNTLNMASPRIAERLTIGPFDLTINPAGREEFPAHNRNRATALVGEPPALDEIERTISAFRSRGIDRFFLWLATGMDTPQVLSSMERCALKQWPFVRYVALARPAGNPAPADSTLEVVRLVPEQSVVKEADVAAVYGNDMAARGFFATLGLEGCWHFVAMDQGVVAAASLLLTSGPIGYLGWSTTREGYRRKGGQAALIETRLRLAAELGCTVCVSETNTAVEGSLRNLLRAGFKPAYEYRVFGP
ncbi:MAG: hypothetical protein AABZ53_09830 [Planctomycetota bacterium]